jgi:hypothetical protein
LTGSNGLAYFVALPGAKGENVLWFGHQEDEHEEEHEGEEGRHVHDGHGLRVDDEGQAGSGGDYVADFDAFLNPSFIKLLRP